MEVLTSLLANVRTGFGRGFPAAGLIPALFLSITWQWYRGGDAAIREFLNQLFSKPADATAGVLMMVSGVCLLGFLFYVSRTLWMRMFQSVPGPWLAPLRRVLLKGQQMQRAALDRQQSGLQWTLTVFRWARMGFSPPPRYVPDGHERTPMSDALNGSRRLRESLSPGHVDLVTDPSIRVLRDLHLLAFDPAGDPDVSGEIAAWQLLQKHSWFVDGLNAAEDELRRRWVEAYMALQSFPNAQWVQPTRLGNAIAAVDDYAERRYGIPTSTLWTRLAGVLSEDERLDVEAAELAMATLINLAVAAVMLVTCVIWSELVEIRLIVSHRDLLRVDVRTWSFVLVGLLMAIGAYHAAVFSCAGWSQRIIRLVDLKRLHLIVAMGFKAPATVAEERTVFRELRGFFVQATQLDPTRPLEPPKL